MSGWRWRDMPHRLADPPQPHTPIASQRPAPDDARVPVARTTAIEGVTQTRREPDGEVRP